MVHSTGAQLSEIAKASTAGIAAATQTPAYGMKRSTVASKPHSSAFGTPMKYSTVPKSMPNRPFTTSCIER